MSDNKYNLVIVESATKAKSIEKYLANFNGETYKVVASYGHIKDLPQKGFGVDLNTFDLEIVAIPGKEDTIKELLRLAQNAKTVFIASDDDREGEAIAFHIKETLKHKDTKRILFREITKPAILKAIQDPVSLNQEKYEAQKTRRVLDRIVGYKISPVLWDKLERGLSAGRVQSVALRLIVEREEEIKNFVPEKWFQISAKLTKDNINFESKYYGNSIQKRTEIENEEMAQKILADIKDQNFKVVDVITKEKIKNATPPFTTSKMQQEASNKLGFNSKKTMQVAQKLYEGIEITGKGRQGLITYMRTDSVRTEPLALDAVRELIKTKYGPEFLPAEPVLHKKKGEGKIQDAHEAIRPTNLDLHPETIKLNLDADEYRLYSLIWNKFIASQMSAAIFDQTTISFEVGTGNFFKSAGSVVKFQGFRAVFTDSNEEKKSKKGGEEEGEEKEEQLSLPKLALQEELTPIEPLKLAEKFTSPPPRFNEASFIKELEDKGIGRPSTFASLIQNVLERKYVELIDKRFAPTELGKRLCKMLVDNFVTQMDISFTAKMEKQLDLIAEGEVKWLDLLKEFWGALNQTIIEVNAKLPSIPREQMPQRTTGIKCVKCHEGEYVIKKGKEGDFLGCSRYPTCNSTKNFKLTKKGIEIVEPKKTYGELPCPKCGKKMVLIKGKNGKFLACEDQEVCKTTRPIPLDITCDKCNTGKFIHSISKNGKEYWRCFNYPTCDHVLWNKPIKEPCTKCEHPYVTLIEFKDKDSGKKMKMKLCPKCNHKTYEKKEAPGAKKEKAPAAPKKKS